MRAPLEVDLVPEHDEPLPPEPYADAGLTDEDGPQPITQDPHAIYVSEVGDGVDS